jgi:phospholipid/cholesterol/gamma-HCH transport system substrate-binding protein
MRKNSRKLIIGLVFLFALILLYWGINFLKGLDVLSNSRYFYVEYDNVSGLLVASPVTVSGFKIGQVTDIQFQPDKLGKLKVKFIVTENLQIPDNSIARIESADLLGSKAIVLHLGNSNMYAKSGAFFKGEMEISLKDEVSLEMLPLKKKVESLLSSFDSALVVVQYIFNESTIDNLNKSFESIRYTISNLESASMVLDTFLLTQQYRMQNIVSHIEAITLNIKNHNAEIANIIANVSQLTDTLLVSNIKSTFFHAEKALADISQITQKVNTGENSISLLLNNDSLYKNLVTASLSLDSLLTNIKDNPERYIHFSVFGRKSSQQEDKSRKN